MPDPLILSQARALLADPARAAAASPLLRRLAWAMLLAARGHQMAQRNMPRTDGGAA